MTQPARHVRAAEPDDQDERPGQPPATARPALRPGRVVTAAVVAVATVVGITVASVAGASDDSAPTCPDGRQQLEVAAAPEIAAAVAAAAADVLGDEAPTDGSCIDVQVGPVAPADVAAALQGPDAGALPDVWIPDSSLWSAGVAPADTVSIARSPLVLAVPQGVAAGLGWPQTAVDPSAVLGGNVRLALADPHRSAVTRAGLLAIDHALAPLADGRARLSSVFLAAERSAPEDASAALQSVTADRPLATFVTEQTVWAANMRAQAVVFAAYYPALSLALDYPFVVLAERPEVQRAARSLARLLTEPGATRRLHEAGFRGPDGTPGTELTSDWGVRPEVAVEAASPDPVAAERAVAGFESTTLGTRMLAVIDVSGSMTISVPGQPPRTRIDLAVGAATAGLALYPDDAELGLWTFSTGLTPTSDHRELVPIGPLGVQPDGVRGREKMSAALGAIAAVPDGDTGLYDTTLAAVRAVRQGWADGRVNSVVLVTDGRNDDADGIPLEQLVATLEAEAADRPVPVIALALGTDADVPALQEISRATHGATYEVQDVRQIREVLADALATRACRPSC